MAVSEEREQGWLVIMFQVNLRLLQSSLQYKHCFWNLKNPVLSNPSCSTSSWKPPSLQPRKLFPSSSPSGAGFLSRQPGVGDPRAAAEAGPGSAPSLPPALAALPTWLPGLRQVT